MILFDIRLFTWKSLMCGSGLTPS